MVLDGETAALLGAMDAWAVPPKTGRGENEFAFEFKLLLSSLFGVEAIGALGFEFKEGGRIAKVLGFVK